MSAATLALASVLPSYAGAVSPPVQTPRPGASGAMRRTGPQRAGKRAPASRRAPGALLLLTPLLVASGAIGVAALHVALGAPFGAAFAARLWDMTQTLWVMLIPWSAFSLQVRSANKAALEQSPQSERRSLRARHEDDEPPGRSG